MICSISFDSFLFFSFQNPVLAAYLSNSESSLDCSSELLTSRHLGASSISLCSRPPISSFSKPKSTFSIPIHHTSNSASDFLMFERRSSNNLTSDVAFLNSFCLLSLNTRSTSPNAAQNPVPFLTLLRFSDMNLASGLILMICSISFDRRIPSSTKSFELFSYLLNSDASLDCSLGLLTSKHLGARSISSSSNLFILLFAIIPSSAKLFLPNHGWLSSSNLLNVDSMLCIFCRKSSRSSQVRSRPADCRSRTGQYRPSAREYSLCAVAPPK